MGPVRDQGLGGTSAGPGHTSVADCSPTSGRTGIGSRWGNICSRGCIEDSRGATASDLTESTFSLHRASTAANFMPSECCLFPQHKGFLVTQKHTAISTGIRPGRPGPGHRGQFRARAEMSMNVGISWFITGGSGTLGKWLQVGGLCIELLSLSRAKML